MRLLLRWVLNALALLAVGYIAPAIGILPGFEIEGFETAVVAVAILSILNLTVRPILKLLSLPITCMTFGLFTLVINAAMMMLTSQLVRGFHVGSFWNAFLASLLYAIISAFLNALVIKEDEWH